MPLGLDNPLHLAIVLLIVLLLFGAKRLPELGRSLGTGLREFKDSIGSTREEIQQGMAAPLAADHAEPAQARPVGSERQAMPSS
jgi:sec-independent protein translocase protein TatA